MTTLTEKTQQGSFKPLPRFNEIPEGKEINAKSLALNEEKKGWPRLQEYEVELASLPAKIDDLEVRAIFDSGLKAELAQMQSRQRELASEIARIRDEMRTWQARMRECCYARRRGEEEYQSRIDGPLKEHLAAALVPYVEALARAAELAIPVSRIQEERRRHGLFDKGTFACFPGLSFAWGNHPTALSRFLSGLRHDLGIPLQETGWRLEEQLGALIAEVAYQAQEFNSLAAGAEMHNIQALIPAQRQTAAIRQAATGLLGAVTRFFS